MSVATARQAMREISADICGERLKMPSITNIRVKGIAAKIAVSPKECANGS